MQPPCGLWGLERVIGALILDPVKKQLGVIL